MLKATATNDGKPVLILGLSHEDLGRLMNSELIAFDASELGFDGEVVIFAADNEKTMEGLLTEAAGHPPIRSPARPLASGPI